MNHIKLFELNEDYLNASSLLPYPCVSYIKESQEVKYEKQSIISVNYRITQDIIDTCSNNGLNEIELYSNSVGSVNSYILNGESYTFEKPLYESIEKTVEYDIIESFYVPSNDSYIHSDNVTLNTLFSTEDDVNLNDYYIYLNFFKGGSSYTWDSIPLQNYDSTWIIISDDLKSFRLNEFAYNKLKNEYEYLFVCYREKSIDVDARKFNELPQVKTYVTYENGESHEMSFKAENVYIPKFEYATDCTKITSSHTFTADRELDIANDCICMTMYELEGNVMSSHALSIETFIDLGFIVLHSDKDNKTISLTDSIIAEMAGYSGIYILFTFCSKEDVEPFDYSLINNPSIETKVTSFSFLNEDKVFNGTISVPLLEAYVDKEYDLVIHLNKTASAGMWNTNIVSHLDLTKFFGFVNEYSINFIYNTTLVDIKLGDSVTSLPQEAFRDCVNLKSAIIGNGIKDIKDYAFNNCKNLTSVTIGNSVEKISYASFGGCDSLTSIIIPDSVTSIENYVFGGCGNLSTITFQSVIAPTLESANPFGECNVYGTLYYPQGSDYSSIISKLPIGWTYVEF